MRHKSRLAASLTVAGVLLTGASIPARAQNINAVMPVAEEQIVRQAAFTLWWPAYEQLVREFVHNTPADAGRAALPEPRPDDFYQEIEIVGRVQHPPIGQITLYSVTTDGDVFQGLFVVNGSRAWPLVNRVDPASFRQDFTEGYVDAVNALLEREDVRAETPQQALALARFMVEVFYNFNYRYQPGSVDSLTFAELNLVRVLQSTDEIPQGVRRFDPDKGNALLYGKIPERVRGTVTPPRVQTAGEGEYVVTFYTWHPVVGELKRWEVTIAGSQFTGLKDQTIEKWSSYTVENF
jgi:hypothetical protein